MEVFGPIPSRRLGRSLGVNNIPAKHCCYSCIYCQVGLTDTMLTRRRYFYDPDVIYTAVKSRVDELYRKGEPIDYITFVAEGEPTLDANLGIILRLTKSIGIKTAIISNASLLSQEDVIEDLCGFDWVSVKVDSVDYPVWRKINRPHGTLQFLKILEGIEQFAKILKGTLVTETMIVDGYNNFEEGLIRTAVFISGINPSASFILTPTRPPVESYANAPDKTSLKSALKIFQSRIGRVELIDYYEGDEFSIESDAENGLLAILSVHPMRKEAAEKYIKSAGGSASLITSMLHKKVICQKVYHNKIYYQKIM